MGLFTLFSKITGIEDKVKWSRAKKVEVIGPSFFGQYYIYIDPNFKVAIFLPKSDKTLHVFIGNIVEAQIWQKYSSNGIKVYESNPAKGGFEWKINPNNVLFKGTGFPPGKLFYEGKVVSFEDFTEEINDQWANDKKEEYMRLMSQDAQSGKNERKVLRPNGPNETMVEIDSFRQRINEEEDLLFGITLFYQGIIQMWAADEATLKVNRESYERTSKRMDEAIRRARELLNEVQENPNKLSLLKQFDFPPTIDEMAKRSRILIEVYDELFPGRPREKPLNQEQNIQLMEVASNRL